MTTPVHIHPAAIPDTSPEAMVEGGWNPACDVYGAFPAMPFEPVLLLGDATYDDAVAFSRQISQTRTLARLFVVPEFVTSFGNVVEWCSSQRRSDAWMPGDQLGRDFEL